MYRLITFILLCANICIADIFAATVKECEVDSMDNDTLIIGKKVICGQKIYPQRDDVITACLAHEKKLYLVGKLKDTLLVITDDPALFSNDAFCDVNFKHFKSPDYKCIKKKQGKTVVSNLLWLLDIMNLLSRQESMDNRRQRWSLADCRHLAW